ncbi:LOW QUALITY PROTEIN: lipase 3 [Drosophila sulfurigaster albostrigata]|uniref:LOW QUALITY PROTEIN: lipase 3 n=1 Tax=Drosophila sulfurigaster albostrigata TaxID=89887 RepID=UPI002D2195CA|nr:LOW QUALITY PROTEIN: lipase 3 [Drosophila sulfurigaster albostrigata]
MLKEFLVILTVTAAVALAARIPRATESDFIDIPFKRLKNSAERIQSHGYPGESHFVETEDGYVLNMFRIPYSPKLDNNAKDEEVQRPVVLIQHGLFSCSDCFLLNGPDNALAYNYADRGYDVWLGNARGNIYSRNNTKININHPNFWAFSWHEIGAYDLPAMIDYILELTGEKALHYVGHSQGCTTFFVMASFRPEYNAKIKTAHMLAPPIFMGNVTEGTVVGLAPYVGSPGIGAELLQNQVFLPWNEVIQRVLDTVCSNDPYLLSYCKTLAIMWGGDLGNLNATLLPQVAETHPAGISTNQGIHFIQSYVSNEFRRYDWGRKKNLAKYGTEEPPAYDLTQITSQVYLYAGPADGSANLKDIARLPQYLSQHTLFEIEDPTWGHLDFIFALKVKEIINDKVISLSETYDWLNKD